MAVAAIGTLVSAYLTWVHYSGSLALCVGVGGCEVVQTSRYAMAGPIPVALLGFAGFSALLGLAVARLRSAAPALDLALFALALGAALYVTYLTYVEVFVLGAVCPWCVAVAACALTIFAIASLDVAVPPSDPQA